MILVLLKFDEGDEHFHMFETEEEMERDLSSLALVKQGCKVKDKEVLCDNICSQCKKDVCCKDISFWI